MCRRGVLPGVTIAIQSPDVWCQQELCQRITITSGKIAYDQREGIALADCNSGERESAALLINLDLQGKSLFVNEHGNPHIETLLEGRITALLAEIGYLEDLVSGDRD